ncbi:MAG TPA: HlyD family secretion protein, partial [Dehalococcoidales bacterium]|nr:HlyD family secretion protein [Dehalococcoidales bacterium]
ASYASTTAVEIIDPSRMELNVNINELDIPNVKAGQKVTITVDALPALKIDGAVSFVGTLPGTDTSMILFPVKITFTLPQNSGIKSGMNAKADIIADKN